MVFFFSLSIPSYYGNGIDYANLVCCLHHDFGTKFSIFDFTLTNEIFLVIYFICKKIILLSHDSYQNYNDIPLSKIN